MILVTGGTGLVGAHLLYHLALENELIRAIYRTKESIHSVESLFFNFSNEGPALFSKIDWVQADITDVISLETVFSKITEVYHAAALVSFNNKQYRAMRKVNIEGTANVVNCCIDKGIQKLCYVSSIAAVGESLKLGAINEENEWTVKKNSSGYSITKYGAEMEVWRASQEGVDVVIVNPGVIIGEGFWESNAGEFFTKIDQGFRFYTEGVTGFVGVYDVVSIMILLMKSTIKNERFVLVSENKSYKEIFDLIARNLGKRRPKVKVTKTMTSILWRIDGFVSRILRKQQRLTKETTLSMHSKQFYSSEKIKKTLKYNFQSMEEVVKETSKHYLKNRYY